MWGDLGRLEDWDAPVLAFVSCVFMIGLGLLGFLRGGNHRGNMPSPCHHFQGACRPHPEHCGRWSSSLAEGGLVRCLQPFLSHLPSPSALWLGRVCVQPVVTEWGCRLTPWEQCLHKVSRILLRGLCLSSPLLSPFTGLFLSLRTHGFSSSATLFCCSHQASLSWL